MLGIEFLFDSYSFIATLNVTFYGLSGFEVVTEDRFNLMNCFSLAAFRILSLNLALGSSIIMCLCADLLEFAKVLGWVDSFPSSNSPNLRCFCAITLSLHFLGCLTMYQSILSSVHFPPFILFFCSPLMGNVNWPIFRFSGSSFCLVKSAAEPCVSQLSTAI